MKKKSVIYMAMHGHIPVNYKKLSKDSSHETKDASTSNVATETLNSSL
jgi:hypothetical protein